MFSAPFASTTSPLLFASAACLAGCLGGGEDATRKANDPIEGEANAATIHFGGALFDEPTTLYIHFHQRRT